MPNSRQPASAFRCVVPPEISAGVLHTRRSSIPVRVVEMSRSDFVITIDRRHLPSVEIGGPLHLDFRGERWEVRRFSEYFETESLARVGLERLRDVTRVRLPRSWTATFSPRWNTHSDPTLLMGLSFALLITCAVMPGLGDRIGTQQIVVATVRAVWSTFVRLLG